jgi:hypothetical protein
MITKWITGKSTIPDPMGAAIPMFSERFPALHDDAPANGHSEGCEERSPAAR